MRKQVEREKEEERSVCSHTGSKLANGTAESRSTARLWEAGKACPDSSARLVPYLLGSLLSLLCRGVM